MPTCNASDVIRIPSTLKTRIASILKTRSCIASPLLLFTSIIELEGRKVTGRSRSVHCSGHALILKRSGQSKVSKVI